MGYSLDQKLDNLLHNSRFWVLLAGLVLSVLLAGLVQTIVPGRELPTIRLEQYDGFVSLLLLYLALLVSPLTKAWPAIPGKAFYLHSRRAVGVLAFYFAFLHVYISFFQQLGGFDGIGHIDTKFTISLLCGVFALGVLFVMTLTSLDWAVATMGFRNWKLLHRLVYAAGVAILIHIVIIGSHVKSLGLVSVLIGAGLIVLLSLEGLRIYRVARNKKPA